MVIAQASIADADNQVPELLGTTENELGIRSWLEEQGHTLVTTSDKEGENSKFDQELVDAEIIITTPYVANFPLSDHEPKLTSLVFTLDTSPLSVSPKPKSSRLPSQPVLEVITLI